jgi:hypothetical protein
MPPCGVLYMNQCDDCEQPISHEQKRYQLTEDGKDWVCVCPKCFEAQRVSKP